MRADLIKHLMLISSIISVPFNVFAEPSENKVREFTTKSSKVIVDQTGDNSSGIVIQQDSNGTSVNAWPEAEVTISEEKNKENNTNIKNTPNSAVVTQTAKNSSVKVKQKGTNNNVIVKQSGSKNSVVIRQE